MPTAIFVACAAQKRKVWVGPFGGLFIRLDLYSGAGWIPGWQLPIAALRGAAPAFSRLG